MPPGRLLVGHRGIPGGGLEPFVVTARLSSGQHNSLDLTIWPSRRNADGARGASAPPRLGGRFGFARLERRSWVTRCPEPAGRPWAALCCRSPPWCRCDSADIAATTARSASGTARGSYREVRPV